MAWEVDWAHEGNTGSHVWARNPTSHMVKARQWHRTTMGLLRLAGIQTPVYRRDSWEVDWSKRHQKLVWARNPESKMPAAHEWHWVDFHTLESAGIAWRPKSEQPGRYISGDGYVMLTPRGMTQADVRLADEYGLWSGKKRASVREHRLVAAKKFGAIPPHTFVRHLNGCKTDNDPDNLVLGTAQENAWDHETARRQAMYWRNRFEEAQREIELLRELVIRATGQQIESGQALAWIERAWRGAQRGDTA